MRTLCLSLELRLKNKNEFSQVFDAVDKKYHVGEILVLAKKNTFGHLRFGLIVPKKHVKLASRRNLYKRLFRESLRLNQHQLPGLDIVVLAKKGLQTMDKHSVWVNLNQLWKKIATV